MGARAGPINLQFGECTGLPRCNLTFSALVIRACERGAAPQRDFRHVGDDARKNSMVKKATAHRDRQFGDAHLAMPDAT